VSPDRGGYYCFGWDNAFIPQGSEKTWGEMNQEERDNTSLRAKAITKLNDYMQR
jgi:inosine/xanthosine triphosphate pyrophosphatase family protein